MAAWLALPHFTAAHAPAEIGSTEARAIAVDAYVYFYPLLSGEIRCQEPKIAVFGF